MSRTRKTQLNPFLLAAVLALSLSVGGCFFGKKKAAAPQDLGQEPDKVLYERAVEDIAKKKYDVARLTLQTLINAYPDSDYLAKAKLAIADSYYEEGGSAAFTHAEVEYKDFITFFPNAPEAPYAQYRAAMCHYQQLEKPDRDRTHALRAEAEFQNLLLNFPNSEYAAEGEKRLVQVQEILADSEFRVGRFYFIRENWRGAASRLTEMVERYPNYSQRDQALWMIAQAWEKPPSFYWKPDAQKAAEYYARLVREHPASEFATQAKTELARLNQPVPEPDPEFLARAQSVQPVVTEDESKKSLLDRMFSIVDPKPDLSAAAPRLGPPPLHPPESMPELPPPPIKIITQAAQAAAKAQAQGGTGTSAQVQIVSQGQGQSQAQSGTEAAPGGTVVNTTGEQKPAEGQAQNQQQNQNQQNPAQPPAQPPQKKKSIWRKIVPFW
ncbi:MAG TPA: outer membrane protein assembly factor BamD [Candidatus Xenobia bacterium]|nr:outer membrane protein assembly factor BamD [Candidatus Xenobia bacterium]